MLNSSDVWAKTAIHCKAGLPQGFFLPWAGKILSFLLDIDVVHIAVHPGDQLLSPTLSLCCLSPKKQKGQLGHRGKVLYPLEGLSIHHTITFSGVKENAMPSIPGCAGCSISACTRGLNGEICPASVFCAWVYSTKSRLGAFRHSICNYFWQLTLHLYTPATLLRDHQNGTISCSITSRNAALSTA